MGREAGSTETGFAPTAAAAGARRRSLFARNPGWGSQRETPAVHRRVAARHQHDLGRFGRLGEPLRHCEAIQIGEAHLLIFAFLKGPAGIVANHTPSGERVAELPGPPC